MLNLIQKGLKTWTGRIIIILAGLALVVSLGFGDVFRSNPGTNSILMVGDAEISASTFATEFRRDMQRMKRTVPSLTKEQAISMGLANEVMGRLASQALLDLEAENLSLSIPNELVRKAVLNEPIFINDEGNFDRSRYEQTLRRANLTAESYEKALRTTIKREQLLAVVGDRQFVPRGLTDLIYKLRNQKRNVEIIKIPAGLTRNIGEPSGIEIEKYYNDNSVNYTSPEYREITYLHLTPETIRADIQVDYEELKDAYEAREYTYNVPESRDLEQILSSDPDLLSEAIEMLNDGFSFQTVATKMENKGANLIKIMAVKKESLPPEAASIVFSMLAGNSSDVIQTSLGWHIFHIKSITPPRKLSLAEVQEDLKRELEIEMALDQLYNISTLLEDELAGGASIEQAGKLLGLDTVYIQSIDKSGKDNTNKEILINSPEQAEILIAAFDTEIGTDTGVIETKSGNYFILRTDGVKSPEVYPLEIVKAAVISDWKEEMRENAGLNIAKQISDRIMNGETLSAISEKEKYQHLKINNLMRHEYEIYPYISPEITQQIFEQQLSDRTPIYGKVQNGFSVAILRGIIQEESNYDESTAIKLRTEIIQQRNVDLTSLYRFSLSKKYPIATNPQALEAFFDAP